MTKMLASVMNVAEAQKALACGADVIDIKDPKKGALGAAPFSTVEQIVTMIGKGAVVSAVAGESKTTITNLQRILSMFMSIDIDIIKIGIQPGRLEPSYGQMIASYAEKRKIVIVLFAHTGMSFDLVNEFAKMGVFGIMLDTANKKAGSLRQILSLERLQAFIQMASTAGLKSGLAGSLRQEDIQPLLMLRPDYMGFRGALCDRVDRNQQVNAILLNVVRSLIPRACT